MIELYEGFLCKSNLKTFKSALLEDTNETLNKLIEENPQLIDSRNDRDELIRRIEGGEDFIDELIIAEPNEKTTTKEVEEENVLFRVSRPPLMYEDKYLGASERGDLKEDGYKAVLRAKRISYRTIQIVSRIIVSKELIDGTNLGMGDELIVPISTAFMPNEYFDSSGTAESTSRLNGAFQCVMTIKLPDGAYKESYFCSVKGMTNEKCLRIYTNDRGVRGALELIFHINMIEGIKYKDEQGNWIP